MHLPELLATRAIIGLLTLVTLIAAAGLTRAVHAHARSADQGEEDVRQPIKRGNATHSGTGEAWSPITNPEYHGYPYGR